MKYLEKGLEISKKVLEHLKNELKLGNSAFNVTLDIK